MYENSGTHSKEMQGIKEGKWLEWVKVELTSHVQSSRHELWFHVNIPVVTFHMCFELICDV